MHRISKLRKILLCIIMLSSCANNDAPSATAIQKSLKTAVIEPPYCHPSNIYGTSFGCYFQSLARNQNFNLMLAFTSTFSKNKYGNKNVSSYYKNKLKFDFVLGKLSNISTNIDTIQLAYANCAIIGTRRKLIINCIIENDSTKILLTNLNENPFY
jgi:hypothetical protein